MNAACAYCLLEIKKSWKKCLFSAENVIYIYMYTHTYTQYIHIYQYLANINLLFLSHLLLFSSFLSPPSHSTLHSSIHASWFLLPKYYTADIRIKSKAFRIRMTYIWILALAFHSNIVVFVITTAVIVVVVIFSIVNNWVSLVAQLVKLSACNMGDLGSIPGVGRSPQEGKGYPLQYSSLKNSMDYIAHGVTKSWTGLSDFHFHS